MSDFNPFDVQWWKGRTCVTLRLYQDPEGPLWVEIRHVWHFHSYVKMRSGETYYVVHFNKKHNPELRYKLVGSHAGEIVELDSSNGGVSIPAKMVNHFSLGLETDSGYRFSSGGL